MVGSLAVVLSHRGSPDPLLVPRMLAAAPHRGDRYDVVTTPRAVLGVSNGRLTDAHVTVRGTKAAAVIGHLDNADELSSDGRQQQEPAELVLELIERHGPSALARLRGVFAGVVVDGDRAWCFRDQVGARPLYWRREGDHFLAATEAKQVVAGTGRSRQPDLDGVRAVFYGNLADDATVVEGVSRVPRACVAAVTSGTVAVSRYWEPRVGEVASRRMTLDDATAELAERLELAVRRVFTGRDCILLSGGVDSTALAAFGAKPHLAVTGAPLIALSAVYPEHPTADERHWTTMVAEHLELPLHTFAQQARPLDDLPFWLDVLDGPVYAFNIAEVAASHRQAEALGVDTVVTGELAEYVYGFRDHAFAHLLLHGRWGAAWAQGRRLRDGRRHGWRFVAHRIVPSILPPKLALPWARWRGTARRFVPAWVDESLYTSNPRPDLSVPARRRFRHQQLTPIWGSPVTHEADEICAAYFGHQTRRPFADIDLWEFFLSLPAEVKFPNPRIFKALMREVLRGRLPDEVVDRPTKTVFNEYFLSDPGYATLRRWILESDYRMPGVRYDVLEDRLRAEDLPMPELMLANELASVHAFVEL
jgi:asparagine synthase (glutamine-hydrolysing)